MTNTHLQINKDLFNLGLNPTEIIILAQVMEWNRTTGDCFESDKSFAGKLSVSERTISRAMTELENRGFITRHTKNVKGGRERHIILHLNKIEEALTTDKKSVVEDSQQTNCPLSTDKITVVNRQNDFIKENIKEKRKDNSSDETTSGCLHPHLSVDCMQATSVEEFKQCW